jgi:uncharacterized protein YjbI with pentapeptide repeats
MKTITHHELKRMLVNHELWLKTHSLGGKRADLSNTRLQDLSLGGVNLQGADLENADMRYTNLIGANLYGANLTDANLIGANLTDANLFCANLRGADFTNAKLQGADLRGADLCHTNFNGTILEKKKEVCPETSPIKQELNIRSEFEALAKKHGMKVASLTLELL